MIAINSVGLCSNQRNYSINNKVNDLQISQSKNISLNDSFESTQKQIRFMGIADKIFRFLDDRFAKPAIFEEFIKDAKLAHNHIDPLMDAIRRGDYEGMEEKGIEILEQEKAKAEWTGVKQGFDEAIRRLKEKDYDWKRH